MCEIQEIGTREKCSRRDGLIWLLATNDPSSNGLCIQAQQKVHVLYFICDTVNSVTKNNSKNNNLKPK